MNSFSISSLNTCSLVSYARRELLKEQMAATNSKIWLIQETHFKSNSRFEINNFNIYRGDRTYSNGGGVAIIIHQNIPIKNFKKLDAGIEAIALDAFLNSTWIQLVSIYIPPHFVPNANVSSQLADFLNNDYCLIGGDFNAKSRTFGDGYNNAIGSWLIDFTENHSLKIINPISPSRLASVNGSYIDKFLSRGVLSQDYCQVIPSFSDHNQILTDAVFTNNSIGKCLNTVKLYSWTKINKLNKYIHQEIDKLNIPLHRNVSPNELDNITEQINIIFNKSIELFVPTVQANYDKIPPSYNTIALKKQIRKNLRKLNRSKRLNSATFNMIKIELKMLKVLFLKNIKWDITNYFKNLLVDIKHIKSFYDTVRTRRHNNKFCEPTCIKNSNGQTFTNEFDICKQLAKHFENNHKLSLNNHSPFEQQVNLYINNLAPTTHVKFSKSHPALYDDCDIDSNRRLLVSPDMVAEIIITRNNKKSSGMDDMPNFILKFLDAKIVEQLSIVFNHAIALGYFPKIWKKALVIPIPKAGKDSKLIENWRPISMLTCLSKIFERVMAERIRTFCDDNKVIPYHQFGFQAGHSTCHPLALLQNQINEGLNTNKITSLVCLDVRAAFDTVWHEGLIFKLANLKFPLYLIHLIFSFLKNRSFFVKIGHQKSDLVKIAAGVPQGSVLGPILFNINSYDFPTHSEFKTLQFADDTAIAFSYETNIKSHIIAKSINDHLETVRLWYANWKLLLNEQKSELIHFVGNTKNINPYKRKKYRNMYIAINGIQINHKKDIKYLGVRLSANNRFVKHMDDVIKKANAARASISHLLRSQFIETKFKKVLYTAYLRPVLTYAAPVWLNPSNISSCQIERLRVAERKLIRQTCNIRRKRHSYKHISNKRVYDIYNRKRIDIRMIDFSIRFHEKNLESKNPLIKNLTKTDNLNNTSDLTYKRSDYLYNLYLKNTLYNDNGIVTLFNKAAYNENQVVYSLAQ